MPFKSEAQRKLFYAAAAGLSDRVDKETAKKFIADAESGLNRKKKLKVRRKK